MKDDGRMPEMKVLSARDSPLAPLAGLAMLRPPLRSALVLAALLPAVARGDLSLADLAEQRALRIGAMILDGGWQNAEQRFVVTREFNAGTVGTYSTRTHPGATTYDWSLTDAAVTWAAQNGLAIHLHPLLYPAQNPS